MCIWLVDNRVYFKDPEVSDNEKYEKALVKGQSAEKDVSDLILIKL